MRPLPTSPRANATSVRRGSSPAPDPRGRRFERFYRVDPELTSGVSGSGLGLYICRQIVEAMGGDISLAPNHPRGTQLSIALPLAGLSAQAPC